jgi:hypothetical protein
VRKRENNIKLKGFGLLMNNSSTEQASDCSKVKKFIQNGEVDAGGFWGVYSQIFCFYTVCLGWCQCS